MFDGLCKIRRAGVTPEGSTQLDMSAADGSWTWHWYLSPQAYSKEVLAIALTAITTDRLVYCQIDDPNVPWSVVHPFGIQK